MSTSDSVKTGLKVLGSLFCIVMMILIPTSTNDPDHNQGLDIVIELTQLAMLVLLWWAPCGHFHRVPYIVWAWIPIYVLSSICVALRFKCEKRKNLKWAFIIGNAALFFISLGVTECPLLPDKIQEAKEKVKFLARKIEKDGARNRGKINFADSAEYVRLAKYLNANGQADWVRDFKL